MARDLHRATLAVMCAFAVVLGASLFPATGFGSNPVPAGDASSGPTGPDTDSVVSTTTEDSGTADEGTTAETTTAETQTTVETTTAASTTATTTTTTPAGYDDSSSGGFLGSLLSVLLILLSGGVSLVASAVGFGLHHRRRYPSQWDLPAAPHLRLVVYVRRIPQTSLAFAMFAGENAPGILDQLGAKVGGLRSGLSGATSGLGSAGTALAGTFAAIPVGFARSIGGLGSALASLDRSVALTVSVGRGDLFGASADRPGADPRSGGGDAPDAPSAGEPDPPSSVREAWARLQSDLGTGGEDGLTPGELARRAVDHGLPTDAIQSLTDAFRDVRYGGYPDEGERAAVASDAYQRIERALEGESS